MKQLVFLCFALTLLIFFPYNTEAQSLQLISSTPIRQVRAISIDKKNMLYLADNLGDIKRYDISGTQQQVFSPTKIGNISSLEAWTSLRVLVFYEEYQEFLILDRFLNQTSAYSLEPSQIGFAKVISLAADNNLWVFDNTDFSLKKYDPINKSNLLITALDLLLDPENHEINFIREYQNILLVNDKNKGILLFDNLGNYKKTLNYPGLNYLGVAGDEICFLNGDRLYFYNIYQDQERFLNLPLDQNWLYAGLIGEYIFTISLTHLYFFKEL